MKKSTVVIIVLILIYVACTLYGTFEPPIKRVRNPQNVYDEIWNLFVAEWQGEKTVLTTATEDARHHKSEGFISLSIPEADIVFEWSDSFQNAKGKRGKGVLLIRMWDSDGNSHWYWYDNESKILCSKDSERHIKKWLKGYYSWFEKNGDLSSRFSVDDPGTYTFQRSNEIFG